MADPLHEGLSLHETYHLIPTESGTELRYTLGPALDEDGARHEANDAEVAALMDMIWSKAFDVLEKMLRETT